MTKIMSSADSLRAGSLLSPEHEAGYAGAPDIEHLVCAMALNNPGRGQYSVAGDLRSRGIAITPSSVRNIWVRYGLETCRKRLAALGTWPMGDYHRVTGG